MRAYIFPLQVTIAKRHGDSEQSFFNNWHRWVRGFEGFEVEVTFLWITAKDPSVEDKDEAYRSQKVLKNLPFCSRNIPFEDVNKTVWDRYAKALKEKKNRDQNMLATL